MLCFRTTWKCWVRRKPAGVPLCRKSTSASGTSGAAQITATAPPDWPRVPTRLVAFPGPRTARSRCRAWAARQLWRPAGPRRPPPPPPPRLAGRAQPCGAQLWVGPRCPSQRPGWPLPGDACLLSFKRRCRPTLDRLMTQTRSVDPIGAASPLLVAPIG